MAAPVSPVSTGIKSGAERQAKTGPASRDEKRRFARRRIGGIILKSTREVGLMRSAGRLVADILDALEARVAPGISTGELNELAERLIAEAGATALFKGVVNPQARYAFPAALCTSVNEEVVHGVPGRRRLNEGDIVSVDCGVRLNGYCGDSARTFAVGRVSEEVGRLVRVTRQALELAIAEVRPGVMWSEVAGKIQQFVEGEGMSVVRDFVGHGIGQEMHEDPKVPNYRERGLARGDFRLERSMTLAIEPMVNLGSRQVRYADADRWTVVTADGRCAAHFEHTIVVTAEGAEVLTAGGGQPA